MAQRSRNPLAAIAAVAVAIIVSVIAFVEISSAPPAKPVAPTPDPGPISEAPPQQNSSPIAEPIFEPAQSPPDEVSPAPPPANEPPPISNPPVTADGKRLCVVDHRGEPTTAEVIVWCEPGEGFGEALPEEFGEDMYQRKVQLAGMHRLRVPVEGIERPAAMAGTLYGRVADGGIVAANLTAVKPDRTGDVVLRAMPPGIGWIDEHLADPRVSDTRRSGESRPVVRWLSAVMGDGPSDGATAAKLQPIPAHVRLIAPSGAVLTESPIRVAGENWTPVVMLEPRRDPVAEWELRSHLPPYPMPLRTAAVAVSPNGQRACAPMMLENERHLLRLFPSGHLALTITDDRGRPLAHHSVMLVLPIAESPERGPGGKIRAWRRTTDGMGFLDAGDLPVGEQPIAVMADAVPAGMSMASDPESAIDAHTEFAPFEGDVEISPGHTHRTIALVRYASFELILADDDGPIPARTLTVDIRHPDGSEFWKRTTWEDGRFVRTHLLPQTLHLALESATHGRHELEPLVLGPGERITRNIHLKPKPPQLEIFVQPAELAAGRPYRIYPASQRGQLHTWTIGGTTIGERGTVRVTGLAAGHYLLWVSGDSVSATGGADEFFADDDTPGEARPIAPAVLEFEVMADGSVAPNVRTLAVVDAVVVKFPAACAPYSAVIEDVQGVTAPANPADMQTPRALGPGRISVRFSDAAIAANPALSRGEFFTTMAAAGQTVEVVYPANAFAHVILDLPRVPGDGAQWAVWLHRRGSDSQWHSMWSRAVPGSATVEYRLLPGEYRVDITGNTPDTRAAKRIEFRVPDAAVGHSPGTVRVPWPTE